MRIAAACGEAQRAVTEARERRGDRLEVALADDAVDQRGRRVADRAHRPSVPRRCERNVTRANLLAVAGLR